MMKETLNRIREPRQQSKQAAAAIAAGCFSVGILLGLFSKWLDNLGLDGTVRWHRWIAAADLGNFFSDFAIWLLLALLIAVFSASALRAALNVFVFFAGMCAAYHLYTVFFSGFNPASYMLLWYGLTALSPVLAALCWFAKGTGPVSLLLDVGILAVMFLSCFAIGFFYLDLKGPLYLPVFFGAAAALYRSPRQLLAALPLGILLAFLLHPVWPNL